MEEFIGDYDIRLTGSFIAKKKKLNQKSVSNFLKMLEKEGILKSKTEGKNLLYSLNFSNNRIVTDYISAVELLRTIRFYKKHPLVKEIMNKIMPDCDGVIAIFGSYAKGIEKKDSDLDLFIAGKCDMEKIRELSKIYNLELSVKNYPLQIFKDALKKRDMFLEEVINKHILVKETQKFIELVKVLRYGKD